MLKIVKTSTATDKYLNRLFMNLIVFKRIGCIRYYSTKTCLLIIKCLKINFLFLGKCINAFLDNVLILYPLKQQENNRLSGYFQRE